MGAQWKNAAKSENSAKRGALISKLVKEIIVASKMGGPDPDANSRLRAAVEAARKQSVPRDTIERGIKKGAGLLEPVNYETVLYEGFAPHQVAVVVECLTDNKNRTASNVRTLFRKGQLGSSGSVMWMFDRVGMVEANHPTAAQDIETVAIEAGAQNVEAITDKESPGTNARFLCEIPDLDTVSKFLSQSGWAVSMAEIGYVAKNNTELSTDQQKEVAEFLNEIDDDDDVHRVYAALK